MTEEVLKFIFNVSKELQNINIASILISEEVFKFDKSNDIKDEYWKKIPYIFFTNEVFKFSKFTDFNEVHPKNISAILVIDVESNFDKSI